ncbi:hypothetical protein [Myceligenerans cantabricum]
MDTSTYTHLHRAGHADLIPRLAPDGIVLVPGEVVSEIEAGCQNYPDIVPVESVAWATTVVLTEGEAWTQLEIKAQLGGRPLQHLGESAVVACAHHRGLIAVLDDRAGVAQADRLGVPTIDTLWIVVEAYKALLDRDRAVAAQIVDDLLATDMYLPVDSGESLFSWAYEKGLLP